MITKNVNDIERLKRGGQILAQTLALVASQVRPAVTAAELNLLAEAEIARRGASPAFKHYRAHPEGPKFPAALCVSVNDEVVHGIPREDKILEAGDIVGLDLGVKYQERYTDAAITVGVGQIDQESQRLITTAKQALTAAIARVRAGAFIGDIGYAIEQAAKAAGLAVVRELVGHGVGAAVHEDPEIPCFGKPGTGQRLVEGMVLAIEPMLVTGHWKVIFAPDLWTVKTSDGGLSAHFEHTVLVTKQGCEILTNVV